MLYSCTHMTTVGVKGLSLSSQVERYATHHCRTSNAIDASVRSNQPLIFNSRPSLFVDGIQDLIKRRDLLSCDFFKSVLQPSSCLDNCSPHPPSRYTELISRLGASSKFPRIPNRTKKYQCLLQL